MRTTEIHNLDPMFLERWSPRSFLPTPVTPEEVKALFEAARWSPSCFNDQPWYYVYATSGDGLPRLQGLLTEKNQMWAIQAPMLVIVFARTHFGHNQQPNAWAKFDVGAATMALNFQAHRMGLSCHLMAGFSAEEAYEVCEVNPETHVAICAMAIGRKGPKENLSSPLQEREEPSGRKPAEEFIKKL